MSKGKVCLAYSGGLDTSIILAWLLDQGYEVVAFMANVGQEEDFEAAEKKALAIGATKYVLVDVQEEFVSKILLPAVQVNAVYEDVYLLGTALARPVITKAQMSVALENNCQFVSHGCTGKGNDQIRFEQGFYAIDPEIQIIAPWRLPEFCEKFKGRKDLIDYAALKGIPVAQTGAKPWSTDENMAHISYEAGILEEPNTTPPKDMWKLINDIDNTPNTPQFINITFEKGLPTKIDLLDGAEGKITETVTGDLNIFLTASKLGRLHGIGRIDIVENRYINLKSRGCYEQAPLTILRQAHVDLEGLTMDKEVRQIRDQFVTPTYSRLLYNGAYFTPECEYIRGMIKPSQVSVNGTVRLVLYKGKSTVIGRYSDSEILYNAIESSMDELTGFSPVDTTGFINIQSIRIKKYGLTKKNRGEEVDL